MAWYYGEFSCGCEGRVNVIGPQKDRQWKADNKFNGLCEECWRKRREEEIEEENRKAEEKAKEMELPELTGSEKQVVWGITLRDKLIKYFTETSKDKTFIRVYLQAYEELEDITSKDIIKIRDYIIENEASSKFYIDNRDRGIWHLIKEFKNIALRDQREVKEERKLIKEIEQEALVVPENKKHDNAVSIKEEKGEVIAEFEKNYDFIDIVKSLGYRWSNRAWRKEIKETTGTATERIAELGNKLLNEGFPVRIYDVEAKEKAITADYKPENDRWIYSRKEKSLFAIKWNGMNDTLYSSARSLPGSRWDNGVTVPFSKWKEVEDFAELYEFSFTKKTLESLNNYKAQFEKDKVIVEQSKQSKTKDGLKDILETEKEILEDLREED